MGVGQVAQRYAKGWLAAAHDKKAVEAVSADCTSLLSMIQNSADFSAFLASPLIQKSDQKKAVTTLAKAAKLHEITASLLGVLAENRRLSALQDVLLAARAMLDAAAGVSRAHVTSAVVLDASNVTDIKAQLRKRLGHDVSVETHVDSAIIGGLVVRVGSTMIDDSVKTKLDRMARRLMGKSAA
jgi:F-type H+-transporting ATPase subunit delta